MTDNRDQLLSDQRAAYRAWKAAKAQWEAAGKPGRDSPERAAIESALTWMHAVENRLLAETGTLQYPPEGEDADD